VSDTFALYQKLYEIPGDRYRRNRDLLTEVLEMGEFLDQPVRQLSLGQKMKANLALAMLHDPEVLYLDEPTIGLDVMSKQVLRRSISALNAEKNTTVILTTHDMNDIESVSQRLILIDRGSKLFDGGLDDFKARYEDSYTVRMEFTEPPQWKALPGYSLLSEKNNVWTVGVEKRVNTKDALMELIRLYDVKLQDIEDIVKGIFKGN
jgi:ABC-2 type transport system ATP-binding protein